MKYLVAAPPASSPEADPIGLEVVTCNAGFERLRPDWNEVVGELEYPSPFQSWEWNAIWWKHFGQRHRLRVIVFRQRGKVIGVAQFYERHSGLGPIGFSALVPIGWEGYVRKQGLTEQWELLFPTATRTRLLEALGRWLRYQRWHAVILPSLASADPSRSLGIPASMAEDVAAIGRPGTTHYRELPATWDAFVSSLNKSMRDNVKYYPRLLIRSGHPFSFEVARSPEDVRAALPVFLELHRARSRAKARVRKLDRFRFRDRRGFLLEVIPALAAHGEAKVGILRIHGRPVAAQIWFERAGTMFMFYTGYVPEWARYSVGMVTTLEALKDGIARGLRRVDFLRGSGHSKARWGTLERSGAHLLLARNPALVRRLLRIPQVRQAIKYQRIV